MIVLGLILVIVAVAAAVLLFLGTQSLTTPVDLEAAGIKIGLTPLALLIAGAIIMLLLWFGLGMMRGSMKRRRRPGREAKEAQRQAELEESIRADERQRAEETHQSALADRDRAKDAEFESTLAERDRTRDEEFRTREREIEDRARADERTRLEREFNARQSATAAAVPAAGVAGAGAAGAGAVGAGAVAGTHHDHHHDGSSPDHHSHDGAEDERRYSPTDADGDVADRGDGLETDAPTRDTATATDQPAHRTMADRIMGRDPEAHG